MMKMSMWMAFMTPVTIMKIAAKTIHPVQPEVA